jgi:cell division septation protein DedD
LNDEKPAPAKSAPAKSTAPAAPAQEPAASAAEPTAQVADTKLTADEVRIIEEAPADPASEDNAASEPEYVTVQVGVFLDEKEASRLLQQMERKGYAPSFFSGRDAEARQWYAVRIGAYSDKQQAANAATNFTRQEKMKAVVRPLGSL